MNLAGQPDMPDAIDVSPAKATIAVDEGLWEPYTPTTDRRDPRQPQGSRRQLGRRLLRHHVDRHQHDDRAQRAEDVGRPRRSPSTRVRSALNGDPRTSGSAFAGVMAASLANGGSPDDIMPGIQFFADLKASGNLIPTEVTQATVISGETPIALDWSYNYPGLKAAIEDAGFTVEINFPSDGVYGGYYAQGVVKDSPHQACGKLWIEHILSNEGALGYLAGRRHAGPLRGARRGRCDQRRRTRPTCPPPTCSPRCSS